MGKHVSGAGRKVIAARGSLPMVALDSLPVIASVTASQASVARRNADFKQNMYLDNPTRFAQLYPDDPRSIELRRWEELRRTTFHGYREDEIER